MRRTKIPAAKNKRKKSPQTFPQSNCRSSTCLKISGATGAQFFDGGMAQTVKNTALRHSVCACPVVFKHALVSDPAGSFLAPSTRFARTVPPAGRAGVLTWRSDTKDTKYPRLSEVCPKGDLSQELSPRYQQDIRNI